MSFSDACRAGVSSGRALWFVVAAVLAIMAAAVSTSDKGSAPLASPALAVKAGRQRGLSVLEQRRLEMEAMAAADAAVSAKRQQRSKASAKSVLDPSLPNGVGIQGRGRAGMNSSMADGSHCVAAMQQRRQSLLAAAEFRPTRSVVTVATAGAGKFDGMPEARPG